MYSENNFINIVKKRTKEENVYTINGVIKQLKGKINGEEANIIRDACFTPAIEKKKFVD